MNVNEANKLRKELIDLHLINESGVVIERISIPNPDSTRYEGLALKIKKITPKLKDNSWLVLKNYCHNRKLKISRTVEKGYWIIYEPKKCRTKLI